MKKENIFIASSFILKVIAIVCMTLDHLGLIFSFLWPTIPGYDVIYPTFRILGRIALPLFCFMIVEGAIHTHKFSKYVIRLSTLAVLIAAVEIILEYVPVFQMQGFVTDQGNIFIDMLAGAVAIYGLKSKGFAKKLLVLPLLFVGIGSFTCYALESYNHYMILWYPFFLRSQYHLISMLLVFGFYGARQFASFFHSNIYHTGFHDMDDTFSWRLTVNLLSGVVITAVALGMHAVATYSDPHYVFWLTRFQTWMILSAIPIIFYSGKQGYKSKWFQYFSYLYYPLHIGVLYGIVYLIVTLIYGG